MIDPCEKAFEQLCYKYDIAFTRPECDPATSGTLDFHLSDYELAVEVKQFSTPRIHDQIMRSGEDNVIVLVGLGAISALDKIIEDSTIKVVRETMGKLSVAGRRDTVTE